MNDNQSVNTLLDLLRNGSPEDPDAEWKAVIALGEVQAHEEREQVVSALTETLSAGRAHALIRAHAVESLGKVAGLQAVPALMASVRDPYRLVRAYSVSSLAGLGDSSEVIDLLLNVLEADEYFGVRAAAAHAVAVVSDRIADASLRQRVLDVLRQRRQAELELSETGVERVIAEIDRSVVSLS